MPSDADQLKTIRTQILADLVELSDPTQRRIDYSIDGQSVNWSTYRAARMADLKMVNEILTLVEPYVIISGVL